MKTLAALTSTLIISFTASFTHAGDKLQKVLDSQSNEHKARYEARNPEETLKFFGVEPGMTVLEALPGGGWYTKILLPYLGPKGELIGVDYEAEMWPLFTFLSKEFVEGRKTWPTTWVKEVADWEIKNAADVEAYSFATMPKKLDNSVDVALFIRALHNLARFEDKDEYLSRALKETHRVLKKGGVMGVVQHSTTDESATGDMGYLEKNKLITTIEKAGFKFIGESSVNENPKDKADAMVWRLPPVFAQVAEDDPKRKEYEAIGESNRMTLKFKKI